MTNHNAYDREWTTPAVPAANGLVGKLSDLGLLTEAAQVLKLQSDFARLTERCDAYREAMEEADSVIVDMYGEPPEYGVPNELRRKILAAFERHAALASPAGEQSDG